MKMFVISLKDLKAGMYLSPMYVTNIPAALRDLQEIINTPGGERPVWAKHPYDFELYQLATWDTENAEHVTDHKFLVNLTNLKAN